MKSKVKYVARSVIEDKVLESLEKGSKVALLLGPEDLQLLIDACAAYHGLMAWDAKERKLKSFAEDLRTLSEGAFGKSKKKK